jgi:septum formation inhibitor-activating ATPase MinD
MNIDMNNTDELIKIKEIIENLSKNQQIDILKILIEDSSNISENNNGSFVNLTEISITTLEKIKDYLNFINKQVNSLQVIEDKKSNLEKKFFSNK